MAKGIRGRRRIASRQCRPTPYPLLPRDRDVSKDLNQKKCSKVLEKKDWEDATCSVCMEYPHNAVLLLCSSHDKGCRPYMCATSCRYSNCLDQYKKAYMKVKSLNDAQPLNDSLDSGPVEKCEVAELLCPLCRGQVKGWTVVESAREYLNAKKRTCTEDKCSYVGTYKELRKHVRAEHPSARPREVDPIEEQKWRRLEREREREDVISTIRSSMPGAVVFGDYVIEGSHYGFDTDEEEEGFDGDGAERNGGNLVNVFLLLHAFGSGVGPYRGGTRRHERESNRSLDRDPVGGFDSSDDDSDDDDDGDDDDDNGDGDNDGTSLVGRRLGRVVLGRSRRLRGANGDQR